MFFIFGLHLPVWGLGASFSISIIISVILLLVVLAKKIHGLSYHLVVVETTKIFIATFISSFFVYYIMKVLDGLILDTSRTINIFILLLIGGSIYLGMYLFISWAIGVKEIALIGRFARKAKIYKQRVVEIYSNIE